VPAGPYRLAVVDRRHGPIEARSPYEFADAVGFGITLDDLRVWAPCYPLDIVWARANGLDVRAARPWLDAGVTIQDAVRARRAGVDLGEVLGWVDAGFAPADAAFAAELAMGLDEALAWREEGFILPDAALLRADGWSLEAAVEARWEGVDPSVRPSAEAAGSTDEEGAVDACRTNGSID
jgi:hypothetical protein